MSNCTTYLLELCAIGGTCFVKPSGEEACLCNPGFGPDFSLYHPLVPDCTKPTIAYVAMLLLQTFVSLVVVYRLHVQSLRSKGMLKDMTRSWMGLLFFVWLLVICLFAQDGLKEAAIMMLCFVTLFCANAAFLLLRLLLEARLAIEMRSSERYMQALFVFQYFLMGCLVCIHIALAVLSSGPNSEFNAALSVWIWLVVAAVLVLASIILYHNLQFSKSLKNMIKDQLRGNVLDEKPDLIRRLRLFRIMVIFIPVGLVPGLILIFSINSVLGNLPLAWVMLTILFQIFSIVGLQLERMNQMIQGFQDAKRKNAEQQRHSATSSKANNNNNSTNMTTNTNVLEQFDQAVAMFARSNYLFYLHPKFLLVGKESIFYYVAGPRLADSALNLSIHPFVRILGHMVGALVVILCWVSLIAPVKTVNETFDLVYYIMVGAFALPLVGFIGLTQMSLPFLWRHLILSSTLFQTRAILVLVCFVANLFVVNGHPTQIVSVVILCLAALLTFVWDSFYKTKWAYQGILVLFSTTVPFLSWFLLAFDYWSHRVNVVVGPIFSMYHFACDCHLFLLVAMFIDGIRTMKMGTKVLLFKQAFMPTRYVTLGDFEKEVLQFGETDFAKPDKMMVGNLLQRNNRRPSSRHSSLTTAAVARLTLTNTLKGHKKKKKKKTEAATRMEQVMFLSVTILESDALANSSWFGKSKPTSRLLSLYADHPRLVASFSGVLIGLPLLIWTTVVLTGLGPESLSFLCLFGFPPLVLRVLVKSKLVLNFMVMRLDFWTDCAIMMAVLVFLALALGFTVLRTAVPLILLGCLFLDYRFMDALVNIKFSTPFDPLFFIPIVVPICFVLPVLGNMGLFPTLNTSSFLLVAPMNNFGSFNATEDVFLQFDPPQGSFQRVRYFQLVFDCLFAFGLKLVLDFVHRMVFACRTNLAFITVPIYPKYEEKTGKEVFLEEVVHENKNVVIVEEDEEGPSQMLSSPVSHLTTHVEDLKDISSPLPSSSQKVVDQEA